MHASDEYFKMILEHVEETMTFTIEIGEETYEDMYKPLQQNILMHSVWGDSVIH